MDANKSVYSSKKVVDHYGRYGDDLQPAEKVILDQVKQRITGSNILDIGVGGGRTTPFLAEIAATYIGIDFSKEMIDTCKRKFGKQFTNAEFQVMDARDLRNFKDGEFALVMFSFNGIDTIEAKERIGALQEIIRVCVKGGYICFSSHNLRYLPDFFRPKFRWHPILFLKSLFGRGRLLRQNARQIKSLDTAEELTIYDDVYDFGLHTFYTTPMKQKKVLLSLGISWLKIFDLSGKELTTTSELEVCKDSWLYYLAKKL